MNTPRSLPPSPPARGSFPLDHGGQCKEAMKLFLQCMKMHGNQHAECRELSKTYLQCRMDKGLMAQEDLNTLGFSPDTKVIIGKDNADKQDEEIIAGLSTAKRKSGIIFGIGSDASRRSGAGHG